MRSSEAEQRSTTTGKIDMPIAEPGCEILDEICDVMGIDMYSVESLHLSIEMDEQPQLIVRLTLDCDETTRIMKTITRNVKEEKLVVEVK